MKKLFLIIIGLCLCTALYADMNTYIIGAVSAGGGYSYIGFPNSATDNNPDTPDEYAEVSESYAWIRQQTGLTGTARRVRVYFDGTYDGTLSVVFYNETELVAEASITAAPNQWVWSSPLSPVGEFTESDLVMSDATVYFGIQTVISSGTFHVMRDNDSSSGASYYYAAGAPYTLVSVFVPYTKDLAVILEY